MQDPATPTTRRRRPRAVSLVASLLLFEAVLVVMLGIGVSAEQVISLSAFETGPGRAVEGYLGALPGFGLATLVIVAGGGLALTGAGLLALREWAWIAAMALQGVGLANALYAQAHGESRYLTLALGSLVIFALNQREVRQSFTMHHPHV
ncbi:MAG: hypothetical protein U0893_06075 [Chloroflexota bacterium]